MNTAEKCSNCGHNLSSRIEQCRCGADPVPAARSKTRGNPDVGSVSGPFDGHHAERLVRDLQRAARIRTSRQSAQR